MQQQGKLIWHIACDESGTGGQRYYGFGSLWMRWQRRGDFAEDIRRLRERHNYHFEIKWQKAHDKIYHDFYLDLIKYFFETSWLAFHCILIRKETVRKELHGGDYDLARRKHFTKFISRKIHSCIKSHPNRDCEFRVTVDPIASRYKKADEAVHVIANNQLAREIQNSAPIQNVLTRDSKYSQQIQLCDLLLGAVMEAWQNNSSNERKKKIVNYVAEHLGWTDLQADTYPFERKFNIWYFYDKTLGPREAEVRPVKLKYPLPTTR